MKKFALSFMFVLVLFLCVGFVEGQLRAEARVAGFHNFTYTNYIQNLDVGVPAIYVYPSTLVVGGGAPGTSLQVVGAAGSYSFNSVAAGSRISFLDPVVVGSVLTVNSDVRAVRFCDVSGGNCLNVASGVPVVGSCPANQYVVRTTTSGVVCSGVDAANVTGDVVTGSCPAGQIVTAVTTGGVTCVDPNSINIPDLGSCPAGSYVSGTTTSGVTCAADQVGVGGGGATPGVCPLNQYVIATTATGVTCGTVTATQVTGDVLPGSCLPGSFVTGISSTGAPTCAVDQTGGAGVTLPSCAVGQYLYWNGVTWACSLPLGLPNPWLTSGSNIYYTGGNVGIGTNNPLFTLDVSGNVRSTGSLDASNINTPGALTAGSIVSGPIVADSVSVVNQKICYASSTSNFIDAVAIPVAPSWSSADCRAYSVLLFGNSGYHSLGCTTNSGSPKATVTVFRSNLASVLPSQITGSCGWTAEPVTMLINGVHTTGECAAAGGTVVSVTGGQICRFNSACASGWSQYLDWSTTTARTCVGTVAPACVSYGGSAGSCTTGQHTWNNVPWETCDLWSIEDYLPGGGCPEEHYDCVAIMNQVGCY